jgi:hypothetical protein
MYTYLEKHMLHDVRLTITLGLAEIKSDSGKIVNTNILCGNNQEDC